MANGGGPCADQAAEFLPVAEQRREARAEVAEERLGGSCRVAESRREARTLGQLEAVDNRDLPSKSWANLHL